MSALDDERGDWRDRLGDPPQQHTLPELMAQALDLAAEDARDLETARAFYADSDIPSARREFVQRVGFDLYDRIREVLALLPVTEHPCECGHGREFHAVGLGCSGSHADSVPCMAYRPWR